MRSIHHVVRWAFLLLLFGLLTACFARLRELGTTGSPNTGQVLSSVPTALATVSPTITPLVTGTQWITTTIIDYAADVLGVVVDEKMQVLHVEVDSATDKAGIQVGDVLDTLDDVSFVKERQKVKDKIHEPNFSEPKKEKKLKLKFKRGDKALEVDVSPRPPTAQPVEGTVTPVWAPQDYF